MDFLKWHEEKKERLSRCECWFHTNLNKDKALERADRVAAARIISSLHTVDSV